MSKNRVIVEAVLAGQSHGAVSRRYGVSKVWVGKLVARYRAGGWDAVAKQSTRPKTNPQATAPEVVDAVVNLRLELVKEGLDAGPHSIAAHMNQRGQDAPSMATIWRILTRAGLIEPEPRKRPKRSYIRFEADLPNECWQADFTHVRLANGTDSEVLTFIDDHSRFVISLTAYRRVSGADVLHAFRDACNTHGIPASTLTDNGFVFTTRTKHAPNAFERELTLLGIEQKNGRPNHPQTQGKVERFQQTLKKWLTARPPAPDLPALQQLLDEFAHTYNTKRPHRSLERRTPEQAYTARAKATPSTSSSHWRIRNDIVDKFGRISMRHAGRLHHIGIGYDRSGTFVRILMHDLHITVIDADTGEIIRDLTLNTERDYQPLGRPPGPPKGSPQRGGRKKTR